MNVRGNFVVAVIAVSLCLVGVSSAATNVVSPALVASRVAGKSITVVINSYGRGTWGGGAFVGGDQIFLGEAAYRDAARGGGVGLFVLLHEVGHTTGIADTGIAEHDADCFALTHIKSVLREFWRPRLRQIQQRYDDALAWPGKYDGNRCAGASR